MSRDVTSAHFRIECGWLGLVGGYGFSNINLQRTKRKSESILTYGELFQRSDRQILPERLVIYPMNTGSDIFSSKNEEKRNLNINQQEKSG